MKEKSVTLTPQKKQKKKTIEGPDGFIVGGNFLFVPEYLAGHLTGLDMFTCQRYTGMDGGNKTYSGSHYFHYTHFSITKKQPEVAFPNYIYYRIL